ncbi:MAG: hypothetical protein AAFW46_08440, partial [Pseudomonadota bacterium]
SIAQIFRAADVVIDGDQSAGDDSTLSVTTTSAISCYCDDSETTLCYFTLWSHTYEVGTVANGASQGSAVTAIPSDLAQQENETIIYTTTTYEFSPDINLVLPDTMMTMSDKSFFRPRKSDFVRHTGNQATNVEVDCSNFEDVFGVDKGSMDLGG